jgi:type VI secretion system secreted protein VgrG
LISTIARVVCIVKLSLEISTLNPHVHKASGTMSDPFEFRFDHPFGGEMEIVRIQGDEGVSELFEFRIEFVDTDPDAALLSADDAIGVTMHVFWNFTWSDRGFTGANLQRDVHGLCTDFHFLGKLNELNNYEVTLRPKLWLATRKTNSRFFLDMTLQDIMTEVLNDNEVTDFSFTFANASDTLHYTVQYQETDFDFVSRLLEKYGATYVFTHSAGTHAVEFRDADGAVGQVGEIKFHPVESGVKPDRFLSRVTAAARLRSNSAVVRDWDPESAGAVLESENSITRAHSSAQNEIFIYPAGWTSETNAHGTRLAEVAAEVETAQSQRLLATGYIPNIAPGAGFTIGDNPVAEDSIGYILLRAQHAIEVKGSFRTGPDEPDDNWGYRGTYEAIPDTLKYPPAKTTPWPRITGPQTAIVTGDGEIDIDDEGRILVLFHWDRDQEASCRIRVAQLWAGNEWGASFVPRIGMEVVVEFMGGDPDRPLVTGTVYNSQNVNPVLPAKKTRSGFRSESSEGGNGYNFFGFDDLAGEEQIYIHAQKDMYREIINDDKLVVHEGNRTVEVEQGNDELTVGQGNMTIAVDSGKIEIEAAQSIELKVGGSSIKIEPSKITIKSVEIAVDASAKLDAKGSIATYEGSAVNNIKGGIVKIN